jgi:hypothetical protein
MSKETETVQNIVARLCDEVYLNFPNASIKMKRQYHKAKQALETARLELDILNDMKEAETPKELRG